jgi:suppressor of ftsI
MFGSGTPRKLLACRRRHRRFRPVLTPTFDPLEDRKLLSVAIQSPLCAKKGGTIPGTGGSYVAGLPFTQPTDLYSQNGVLSITLTVSQKVVNVSGRRVQALVYDGSYTPPTLHVKPGDQLDILLVNDLNEATNLHLHGMHVSPSGNSDNIFITVQPHTSFQYVYNIPMDQPVGMDWYHPHVMGTSEEQVFGGMAGAIIVEGETKLLPADLQGIKEYTFDIKDLQVKPNGAIVSKNINSNAPTTRTINGLVQPKLDIAPGETQLWHLANMSADIWYDLKITGNQFTVIGEDGNPVWNVTQQSSLVMPPGQRFSVLVQGHAGISQLLTKAYSTGPAGDQYPTKVLATLVSRGPAQTPAALPTGGLVPASNLANATIEAYRTFVFTENAKKNQYLINGVSFDPNVINVRVPLGSTEQWTLINDTQEEHPFHIHVNPFEVMSINGVPYHANSLQDVVALPVGGTVVIRQTFADFTGTFVFHCHILAHEDMGMMQSVQVY